MLMSFLRGKLPWDGAPGFNDPADKSEFVKMKENLDFDVRKLFFVDIFLLLNILFTNFTYRNFVKDTQNK